MSHPASDVIQRTNHNINNNNIQYATLRASYRVFTQRMASDQVDHLLSYFTVPVMAITDGWVVSIRPMLLTAEALMAGKSVISKDHSKITNDPTLSQWNVDEFGTSLRRKERTSPLHYFKEKETTQQQNMAALSTRIYVQIGLKVFCLFFFIGTNFGYHILCRQLFSTILFSNIGHI